MGLPEPPELGASALPKGSFENQTVVVTGGVDFTVVPTALVKQVTDDLSAGSVDVELS